MAKKNVIQDRQLKVPPQPAPVVPAEPITPETPGVAEKPIVDAALLEDAKALMAATAGPTAPAPLRTDGPTLEEYVAAGYKAENYPPQGYAPRESKPAPYKRNAFGFVQYPGSIGVKQ